MPPRRTSSVIAIIAASARSDSSASLAALYCESLKTRSLRRLQRTETISGRHNTDTARPSVRWRSSSTGRFRKVEDFLVSGRITGRLENTARSIEFHFSGLATTRQLEREALRRSDEPMC